MLEELQRLVGPRVAQKIAARDEYSNQATVLMQLYSSGIVGGNLTSEGAERLINGTYETPIMPTGHKADPNGAGLDGVTALMSVILKGDLKTVESLLVNKTNPNQHDSSGATPLHFAAKELQPEIAKVLLSYGAEPHIVDQAGFSAWMLVGENKHGFVGALEKSKIQELTELLRPEFSAETIIEAIDEDTWERDLLGGKPPKVEAMKKQLRLAESLFFDDLLVRRGAYEGRRVRGHLLTRLVKCLIELLQTDPLCGNKKVLTRYILESTKGPNQRYGSVHIQVPWPETDNRSSYRNLYADTAQSMLAKFGAECELLTSQIAEHAESKPGGACAALRSLPPDEVIIPQAWQQRSAFWKTVQKRQLLRFDPPFADSMTDGASCCVALLRLGAIKDLAEYIRLVQVESASFADMFARAYIAFAQLCNKEFQIRMRGIAARVAKRQRLDVQNTEEIVQTKRLPRLSEKCRAALAEHGNMAWPDLEDEHIRHSHSFYILDVVRMSFVCRGATVADQVYCCMQVVEELCSCTVEADGICVLRKKSGFSASTPTGKGGYADVKLLMYADLGSHMAFDGSPVPLQLVGEVQVILEDFMKVKSRMHLVYEVDRGSFDQSVAATLSEQMLAEAADKRRQLRKDVGISQILTA